jgi:hypothetical protein
MDYDGASPVEHKVGGSLKPAPNIACSGQGFALVVRGGLLAMVLVCDGVSPVRPAANANRWVASLKDGI